MVIGDFSKGSSSGLKTYVCGSSLERGKDLEAKSILMVLKAIDWKGKERYRVTQGAWQIEKKVVVVWKEWSLV